MMSHPTDETLVTWLERDPADSDDVWEHLFACTSCTERAEELRGAIASLHELGKAAHNPLPTVEDLAALERRGTRLQHVSGKNGNEVEVTIGDVDVIAMHVPLAESPEDVVDIELCRRDGTVYFSATARPEEGEVVIACHRSIARANPALRVRVVERARERVLFDGIFANA